MPGVQRAPGGKQTRLIAWHAGAVLGPIGQAWPDTASRRPVLRIQQPTRRSSRPDAPPKVRYRAHYRRFHARIKGDVERATANGAVGVRRDTRYLTILYPVSATVPTHVCDSRVAPSISHTHTSPSVA
jgi:hypothetical protein